MSDGGQGKDRGSGLSPEIERNLRGAVAAQGFLRHIGYELASLGAGTIESVVRPGPEHGQQDHFVHGGVLAAMADVTGGVAALSLASATARVLTVELKISFLEPAAGERLLCRARVLRQGKRLSHVEAEVFARTANREEIVAKALATYALREPRA